MNGRGGKEEDPRKAIHMCLLKASFQEPFRLVAVSATRAQGQEASAEKAAAALGTKLTALAAEVAVAEAMAAEKVRVREELLSQL